MESRGSTTPGAATPQPPAKEYLPPPIPETPSRTINDMLQQRFGSKHNSSVKAVIGTFICAVFTAINLVYSHVNTDKQRHSHTVWMIACGVVSLTILVAAALVYNIIISAAWVLHTLLYYAAWAFALAGVGLGISGAVFFDKNANIPTKPTPGSFRQQFYEADSKSQ